ncbi:LTA synthase family protein [Psychromonas sp. RZ22]|uniref:LTA synthase family protein n=1 Tax=Psychromonas algarum TaxID=2555643 RepID=UPI0010688BAA|nr:LTA synthase family protein [Psychromonas sp. RZ22]TEW56524.1 LTA synthase family protein [Psychromonas sp. RZ22]
MLDNAKQLLGVLFPVVAVFLLGLIILTISRAALCTWQAQRVKKAQGLKTIFISGLRMDIVTLSYLLVLPGLLSCLLTGIDVINGVWLVILQIWLIASIWLLIYMEVSSPTFIKEYDVRPNRFFIEYLIYPKEVISMLWTGYKLELFISLVASLATLYFGWIFSSYLVSDLGTLSWYWRLPLGLLVIALCLLGARSSFGHRGINPSMIAFSNDNLMNDLALNSSYSVLYALKLMQSEEDSFTYYPKMEKDKIVDLIQKSTHITQADYIYPELPTLVKRPATHQGKPKNLVILLQESLGSRFVGGLGGLPLTPNLDEIIKESWHFTRLYATGTRSIRGIEAVTSGFSPTPANAVVKLSKSQSDFYTIAQTLHHQGYHTQFVYGGESHFDNMKGFFLGNGFCDIQDLPTFIKPQFVGSWGACDEDLYDKAHQQFTMLQEKEQPFFSLVFTTTNHSPYEYPEGKIEQYNSPAATRENTVKYSDFAFGEFIKQAKASDYWDETVFVVVADHDSRVYGDQAIPIELFNIPAIIFGGGIEAKKDERIASQLDLPPTLLSLIGVDNYGPMIGHDLTQDIAPEKLRAMMQFHKTYAWVNNDNDAVVFQANKAVETYHYDSGSHQLHPVTLPQKLIETANANALWGSLAYKNDYYRWSSIKATM